MEFNDTDVCDAENSFRINDSHSANIWIFGNSMSGASNHSHSLQRSINATSRRSKNSSMQFLWNSMRPSHSPSFSLLMFLSSHEAMGYWCFGLRNTTGISHGSLWEEKMERCTEKRDKPLNNKDSSSKPSCLMVEKASERCFLTFLSRCATSTRRQFWDDISRSIRSLKLDRNSRQSEERSHSWVKKISRNYSPSGMRNGKDSWKRGRSKVMDCIGITRTRRSAPRIGVSWPTCRISSRLRDTQNSRYRILLILLMAFSIKWKSSSESILDSQRSEETRWFLRYWMGRKNEIQPP